jgi:cytochrome P450/NADPH-cytochrome P450 reductase
MYSNKSRSQEVRVPLWTERGALRMPASLDVPLVLVGPGTGIAPFRAFLEERHTLAQQGLARPAPCYLLFGCRNREGCALVPLLM